MWTVTYKMPGTKYQCRWASLGPFTKDEADAIADKLLNHVTREIHVRVQKAGVVLAA